MSDLKKITVSLFMLFPVTSFSERLLDCHSSFSIDERLNGYDSLEETVQLVDDNDLSLIHSDQWINSPDLLAIKKKKTRPNGSLRVKLLRFSYEEVQKINRTEKLYTYQKYHDFRKMNPGLKLPPQPDRAYEEKWVDWNSFLAPKPSRFLSYSEAYRIIQEESVSTYNQYHDFRKMNPDLRLPSQPDRTYKEDWVDWNSFLAPKKPQRFLSYSEARKIVQKADIFTKKEYRAFCKIYNELNPEAKLPLRPDSAYDKDWSGWGSFLIPKYEEAREIVQGKGVSTVKQYRVFRELNPKLKLPFDPAKTYKRDWSDWGSFLASKFVSYEEAKRIVHEKGISTMNQYHVYRKANPKKRLPSRPDEVYREEWEGRSEFLAPQLKEAA